MTVPAGIPVRYDVTRDALSRALGNLPYTAWLNREAREKFADALLAQMPAVAGDRATVSMADLITVLGEAEGFIGGKDNAAFTRLAEAAGVA